MSEQYTMNQSQENELDDNKQSAKSSQNWNKKSKNFYKRKRLEIRLASMFETIDKGKIIESDLSVYICRQLIDKLYSKIENDKNETGIDLFKSLEFSRLTQNDKVLFTALALFDETFTNKHTSEPDAELPLLYPVTIRLPDNTGHSGEWFKKEFQRQLKRVLGYTPKYFLVAHEDNADRHYHGGMVIYPSDRKKILSAWKDYFRKHTNNINATRNSIRFNSEIKNNKRLACWLSYCTSDLTMLRVGGKKMKPLSTIERNQLLVISKNAKTTGICFYNEIIGKTTAYKHK